MVGGPNDTVKVKIDDREYTTQEISAMILQKMKKTAEDYLGQEVSRAVITVPAYLMMHKDRQLKGSREKSQVLKVEKNHQRTYSSGFGLRIRQSR